MYVEKRSHCSKCFSVLHVYCKCVCVYMCASFYVFVMWDHVVDSYSPGLYDVNVSLNYFVHRRKLGSLLAVPCLKKKLNTFLTNVEHANVW